MIEENNLKEEFAKDSPNSWGRRSVNPTSWLKKKEINIPNPAEKGCIIYIDNDGNEISRDYGRKMKEIYTDLENKMSEENEILMDSLKMAVKDFIEVLKGEGCETYQSSTLNKVIHIKQLEELII